MRRSLLLVGIAIPILMIINGCKPSEPTPIGKEVSVPIETKDSTTKIIKPNLQGNIRGEIAPAVSPDGNNIILPWTKGVNKYSVWNINLQSLTATKIHETEIKSGILQQIPSYFVWNKDSSSLAMIAYGGDKNKNLYILNPTSGNITELTDFPENSEEAVVGRTGFILEALSPKWSPDGQEIIFWTTGKALKSINTDTKEETTILENLNIKSFDCSPKDDKIVLIQENLYLLDLKTRDLQKLTDEKFNYHAVFDPKGKRILYYGEDESNDFQLRILDLDNKESRNITNTKGANPQFIDFRWSKDGKQIAFIRQTGKAFGTNLNITYSEGSPKARTILDESYHPVKILYWSDDNKKMLVFGRIEGEDVIIELNLGR